MELKEKLELLWKYLILLVFVVIASSHLCRGKFGHCGDGHPYYLGGSKQGCWQHRGGHDFHSDAENMSRLKTYFLNEFWEPDKNKIY